MVLEALISPMEAEKRPWQMFFLGLFFCMVGLFLANWIFHDQASLVLVFLIVMASLPIVYNTVVLEEEKDEQLDVKETELLREHIKALSVFMFLFLGITIMTALFFVFLPLEYVTHTFSVQAGVIRSINGHISGNAFSSHAFHLILFNNLKVLLFCILFSFLYGVGALFILTWNATVIGVALGGFVRSKLAVALQTFGLVGVSHYFQAFSLGILRYMTHGVFEILAYFVAGLAGGIISLAVMKHHFGTRKFTRVLFDTSELLLFSLLLLFIGAFVEVYITPRFFA